MDPDLTTSGEPRTDGPHEARAVVHDRRPFPAGALPRQLQTWIMVGLAVLILGVILMTGRPTPGPVVPVMPTASTGVIPTARVRSYQERLAEQEVRLQPDAATPGPVVAPDVPVAPPPVLVDPLDEERRRRDEHSLFADNVAFTRRAETAVPMGNDRQPAAVPPTAIAGPPLNPVVAPGNSNPAPLQPASGVDGGTSPPVLAAQDPDPASLETLTEGTVIEAVLVNRLDGTFQGPVHCLVTTPVYSHDRQAILIPAGARVLGSATAVQTWGESRLAVHFHRLLLPDGRSQSLESVPGLNQVGETGLRDQVDRHYWQVFGASVAIGAIAGLAQVGTRGSFDASFGDAARQSAGGSLATSTARVLDRYLNVLPTVTIREGHRIKVVLTHDLRVPVYGPAPTAQGGV